MPSHKCSYFMCQNTSEHKSMFRFPWTNLNRLQLWIHNCGNMIITHWRPERLKSKYICIDHFEPKFIKSVKGKRKLLHANAVPNPYKEDINIGSEESSEIPKALADLTREVNITPEVTCSTYPGPLRCSFCSSLLQKIYKCVQCEDVLLCENCERTNRHPIHCVLRISSLDLYVKVKETFPTLHRLFDKLMTGDEDSKAGDSDATRSSAETDLEDEMQNTSKVCSDVTESTVDTLNKHKKSHKTVRDHKSSGTTDTKHQSYSRHSRKRKHNTVAVNTKKPTSEYEVNTTIDEPTIRLREISPGHNDPLDIDYTIKTEPVEDNTTNLESMDTIIEHDIKQEVKEEPADEDISDEVSTATVTYLYRASNNMK